MKQKIIISESQYRSLATFINETKLYENKVTEITKFLDMNYNKVLEKYRDGNDYKQRKAFEVKADGDIISPKDLLKYLLTKFNVGEAFLKQLLEDWCDNKIKDGRLSKNVALTD